MNEKKVASFKVKRQTLISQQDRIKDFVRNQLSVASVCEVETRLKALEKYYVDFNDVQSALEEVDSSDGEVKFRALFEELYFMLQPSLVTAINDYKRSTENQVRDTTLLNTTVGGSTVRLPKVQLPTFSGDYTKWMSYFEIFTSLVDSNDSLDPITKFHYLLSSLAGEALRSIESIEITAKNYTEVLQLLQDRYANTSIIVEEHVKGLLNLPSVSKTSATSIRELIDSVNLHLRSLTSLGRPVAHWDDIIICVILSKLDNYTNDKWIDERPTERLPTLKELLKFLGKRCQQLERKTSQQQQSQATNMSTASKVTRSARPPPRASFITTQTQGPKVCTYCSRINHNIYRCRLFLALTPEERFSAAHRANLCTNCLRAGHGIESCPCEGCRLCQESHHSLIHAYFCPQTTTTSDELNGPLSSGETIVDKSTSSLTQASLVTMKSGPELRQTLLATAVVNVVGSQGQLYSARAILDPGSQVNLITEALALILGLKRYKSLTPICGIDETSTYARHTLYTQIQSALTAYSANLCFHVLPRISEPMPNFRFSSGTWKIPSSAKLADPNFDRPSRIDILIGADIFYDLLLQEQIRLGDSYPVLQSTQLGYIVSGPIAPASDVKTTYHCKLTTTPSLAALEKILRQFWELEGHNTPNKCITEEERLCELHFTTNFRRSANGRFIVRLPFRQSPSALGHSLGSAQRRLFSLERKFKRQPDLQQKYVEFMNDYENLKHMRRILSPPVENYFLPHHCVIKADSSSTKVRVVFDASAKSSTNVSLNDILMTGPTVQSDLFTVLTRFRSYRWVFTTDIKQMYRQIEVDCADRPYQMIAWRCDPNEPVNYFQLNTVTYGTSAAPYLATRCLNQLATEEASNFPSASASVLKETYVDDIMTGSHNLNDAISLQTDLIQMLGKAHFELRKFCANDPSLLHSIPEEHREPFLRIGENDIVKTLGLSWEPREDAFLFHISFEEHELICKRSVLSDLGKIFDPLGLIGPVIVLGKVFLQEIWKLKTRWDEALPTSYQEKWSGYVEQLQLLRTLRVSRHLLTDSPPKSIQLHAFADSSESAFGACCYLRSEDEHNNVKVKLICSKSRVAPTQSTTIPRLELCAAVLMIELVERIQALLPLKIQRRFLYTDSKIVLAWIAQPSYTWQTFVANRVAKIQELSRISEWSYINTKENPADIISRGALPAVFLQSTLWTNGPEFLQHSPETWPQYELAENLDDVPDQRHSKSVLITTRYSDPFSSVFHRGQWQTLEKIFAYCFRFVRNARLPKHQRTAGPLTPKDLDIACTGILINIQRRELPNDYLRLLKNKQVDKSSRLKSLDPFLDDRGLIRVGGRLQNSLLDYDAKHQIILPKNEITKMLLNFFHSMNMHAGQQALLAAVRQRYWPIDGKSMCRSTVENCVRCFRSKPTMDHPLMGMLPPKRVQPARPFLTTGIDFCGPIRISSKIRGRAPIKAYLCVFVCFATKAVHLEVVSDLSSEAFIAALRRFIARRGLCKTIFSDNATNFVGAKNELAELQRLFQTRSHLENLNQMCLQLSIEWHHIPARSPHFGGLWEAAVKKAKYHLIRVVADAVLTFEELCTVVAQVEAVVNSRPITPLSSDPNDMEALTPGHFLIGCPLTSFPEPDVSEVPSNRLSRFRRLQQLQQVFWKRWSAEYLQLLQQRNKWTTKSSNIEPDTLVIIQEDNLPSYKWALGRVLKTFPGRDGVHRVAEVKTQHGIFKRAVAKLYPLPMED